MRTKVMVLEKGEYTLERLNMILAEQRNDSMVLYSVDYEDTKERLILKFKNI